MSDVKIQRLLKLLEVERETRQAQTRASLGYHVVTRSREIFPYIQGALIAFNDQQTPSIVTISDVAAPDHNGPFCLWLKDVIKDLIKQDKANQLHEIDRASLKEDLKVQWSNWAPEHVVWAPLLLPNGQLIGGLWLTRDTQWAENEIVLIERLADCYAHAWKALQGRNKIWRGLNKKIVVSVAAACLLLGLVPVKQSTLAPAEIVPEDPLVISSPLDGVILHINVLPYHKVKKGEELIRFDETVLKNEVAIAKEALEVTKAEFQTARQSAFHDLDSQSKLALLQAQVGLREAELAYAQGLLDRGVIVAPEDGVVVFRDVNDWTGRPTQTGEKIMLLANPDKTQLKIDLPVSDAISLDVGADVRLFLDVDPLSSYEAKLVRTSYETELSPTGQGLNFQVIADFTEMEEKPRIGLRGTAKIYGDTTVLGLYIFRKPLAAARKWLGW